MFLHLIPGVPILYPFGSKNLHWGRKKGTRWQLTLYNAFTAEHQNGNALITSSDDTGIHSQSSVRFSHSVMSDSLKPHGLRMPSFPVYCQLLQLAQTHVHRVGDAIQPSHPLPSLSLPAPNLSQHQGLFKWVSSSHQVAKVLEFQLQPQSFQWIFRTDFLYNGLVGCPCSPKDSQESSPTPQFKSINSLRLGFLYGSTLTSTHDYWKSHSFDYMDLCWQSNVSAF